MAIRYISYTKEQRSSTDVTGYSLYVNGIHLCVCESMHAIKREAYRYSLHNDIEIYPILKRRIKR